MTKNRWFRTPAFGPRVCAALIGVAACTKATEQSYTVDIIGPAQDVFAGAVRATLELDGRVLDQATVTPRHAIDLSVQDFDTKSTPSGVLRVRGTGPQGELVAFGQTPPLDLMARPETVRIYVQKPGSFGRTVDLLVAVKSHVAVATTAPARADLSQKVGMPAAVFGTGTVLGPVPAGGGSPESFSSLIYAYNPISHEPIFVGSTASSTGMSVVRTAASAITATDGTVLIFGGQSRQGASTETHVTSQLDVFGLQRADNFGVLKEVGVFFFAQDARVSRAGAAVASAGSVYAFAGYDDLPRALDSVVAIRPEAKGAELTLVDARMAAPRSGHTATGVPGPQGPSIVVFGGAPVGAAVAELFLPGPPATLTTLEGAGPGRHDHAAVLLPASGSQEARVLVVGGVGDDGQPLGTSVVYSPQRRAFEPGPITLKTPRTAFTAFIVGGDLVIAGGGGAGGLIANAEIYDVETLAFVAEVPAFARARATATALGNESVLLMGGEIDLSYPTEVAEIYQPRRK